MSVDPKFPEILVEREGVMPTRIRWIPPTGESIDLSNMRVLDVKAHVPVADPPTVTLVLSARLVDVEP